MLPLKSWRKPPLNDFFIPTTGEACAMSWPKPLLTFLLLICDGKVSSIYGASHSRAPLLSDTHWLLSVLYSTGIQVDFVIS